MDEKICDSCGKEFKRHTGYETLCSDCYRNYGTTNNGVFNIYIKNDKLEKENPDKEEAMDEEVTGFECFICEKPIKLGERVCHVSNDQTHADYYVCKDCFKIKPFEYEWMEIKTVRG